MGIIGSVKGFEPFKSFAELFNVQFNVNPPITPGSLLVWLDGCDSHLSMMAGTSIFLEVNTSEVLELIDTLWAYCT